MPTDKPRINVTLPPHVYETISRLAALEGRSRSYVVADLLVSVHPPLMRTVALLEAAKEAPKQVQDGLRSTLESVEQQLGLAAGGAIGQLDWLIEHTQEAPSKAPGASRSGASKGPKARPKSKPKARSNPRPSNTGVRSSRGTGKQGVTSKRKGGR